MCFYSESLNLARDCALILQSGFYRETNKWELGDCPVVNQSQMTEFCETYFLWTPPKKKLEWVTKSTCGLVQVMFGCGTRLSKEQVMLCII